MRYELYIWMKKKLKYSEKHVGRKIHKKIVKFELKNFFEDSRSEHVKMKIKLAKNIPQRDFTLKSFYQISI